MLSVRTLSVAMLVMVAVCPVRSQDDGLLKILSAVDQKQRPQLARRLRLFMDHQRKRQWDELFKLIDKVNAEHWRGKDFATMMARFGHIDFVPERSAADDDHGLQYRVYGCVKVRREEKPIWFQGGLVAYLQEGDWYFTPYFLQYDRLGSPVRCNKPMH